MSEKKEEVVVLTGVRARMAAYQKEIQRQGEVQKKYTPVFKVADDLGASFHSSDGVPVMDKKPVEEDTSMRDVDHSDQGDADHVFQRSMHMSGRGLFTAVTEEDLEEAPEKPQAVKDEEEKQAKEKIGLLLARNEETKDEEPVVLQAFSSVQRRYLQAVSRLRPKPLFFKKPGTEEAMEKPEVKAEIKKTLGAEMDKSKHLTELTTTWDDYYEKAQDKPVEEEEVKRVEEEVKQVEQEVNNEWSDYAEKVVEVVETIQDDEDGDSVASADSDVVKWREEARRLKAEAEERKKAKADREQRKKKRAQVAAMRKKRAEEAAARRRAEEEAAQKDDEEGEKKATEDEEARLKAAAEALAQEEARSQEEARAQLEARAEEEGKARTREVEEARAKAEEAKKKTEDMSSSDSEDSSDLEPEKKPAREKAAPEKARSPETKGTKPADDSDSESSEEKSKATKKKSKKKKEKDTKMKEKEKKRRSKKKDAKKKGGDDDSDLDDGPVEEYPRNLDGSLWKNPLKFWTNKPRKLNEVAPKIIMRPNGNSDIFCKSEDAINDNACFYWHKFEGDFNVLVKIKGDLKTSYDKAGIMIRQDERNWVMSGLEYFNKRINHSSCITRGISDWSLAPLPEEAKDGIWVAIKRHDNKVECFYSFDLKEWIQTRQGLFPTDKVVKVGVVGACPMGEPFKVVFERFRIQMVG